MRQTRVELVKERHESDLLAVEGVVGVGIGERGNQAVILVFVDPPFRRSSLPKSIEGVRVIVEETGGFEAS